MNRRYFLLLLLFVLSVQAKVLPYAEIHHELTSDIYIAKQLGDLEYFKPYQTEFEKLEHCVSKADTYAEKKSYLPKVYLKQLRACAKMGKKFDGYYIGALRKSIKEKDNVLFQALVERQPRVLSRDRWIEKSVSYYKKNQESARFEAGDKLLSNYEKDDAYRQLAAAEMEIYEANVKVLSYAQAKKSRNKQGKIRKFFVGYKRQNGRIVLIAENNNVYPVSLNVKLRNLQNYRVDKRPPYHIEIGAHSKRTVMTLSVKDKSKKSRIGWQYSWIMGRESARHDNSYRYALPFKIGSRVIVSQGFNGSATHTGRSRYAVDFVADVGTRIYAARGGKVISVEDSFNKGGFSKAFGAFANYINIEHTDGTIAKYYHLKQYGVNVKVGQYVSRGQFIGLSGNTGYSSGPHLHFGVYKVDSNFKSSITLPFVFKTNLGEVDAPHKGHMFKVVR